MKLILIGTFASLIAGSATILGALSIFFMHKISKKLLDVCMGFAAGAMLFVTSEEVIPETHSRGNVKEATVGLILGFVGMLILENIFV